MSRNFENLLTESFFNAIVAFCRFYIIVTEDFVIENSYFLSMSAKFRKILYKINFQNFTFPSGRLHFFLQMICTLIQYKQHQNWEKKFFFNLYRIVKFTFLIKSFLHILYDLFFGDLKYNFFFLFRCLHVTHINFQKYAMHYFQQHRK